MNTLNVAIKSFTCGVAALAISAVLSWSFVQSTNTPPFSIKPAAVVRTTVDPGYLARGAAARAVATVNPRA